MFGNNYDVIYIHDGRQRIVGRNLEIFGRSATFHFHFQCEAMTIREIRRIRGNYSQWGHSAAFPVSRNVDLIARRVGLDDRAPTTAVTTPRIGRRFLHRRFFLPLYNCVSDSTIVICAQESHFYIYMYIHALHI